MSTVAIQRTLWESRPTTSGELEIHLKPYLQPFERELGIRELTALGFEVVSFDARQSLYIVRHENSEEGLERQLRRLTYFDWYCAGAYAPTLQACREAYSQARSGSIASLPKRRVLRFGPHDLHEYRGKYFPQLVRALCNIAGLSAGSTVVDPMCGSGTTLVECRALDINSIGIDRNPLSALIAKVKTLTVSWTPVRVDRVRNDIQKAMALKERKPKLPWNSTDLAYLERWFSREAVLDIGGLIACIDKMKDGEAQLLSKVCLSDIVRSVSHQNEDDLRVRKSIKGYEPGTAILRFNEKLETTLDQVKKLCTADCGHDAEFRVVVGDARKCSELVQTRADGVITSPPYATALPYIDTDRLSLVVLGLANRETHREIEREMIGTREISEKERLNRWENYCNNKKLLPGSVTKLIESIAEEYHGDEVGFRRRNLPSLLAAYFLDIRSVLISMRKLLRRGATAFFVVGNNSTNTKEGKLEIHTDVLTMDIAASVGLTVSDPIDMELLVSRDIFKTNRGSREQILIFQNK
jgi:hypothetical protein